MASAAVPSYEVLFPQAPPPRKRIPMTRGLPPNGRGVEKLRRIEAARRRADLWIQVRLAASRGGS